MSTTNKKPKEKEVTGNTYKDNKETEDTFNSNCLADGTDAGNKCNNNGDEENIQAEEPVIYIGPDLKNIVSRNTIFKNGIPEEITKEAGRLPVVMKLFVPLKKLPEALKTFAQGGFYKTLYDNALKQIAETNNKGGESHE